MAELPPNWNSPTIEAIYESYVKSEEARPRPYLGASAIGTECSRALWYGFRWCSPPSWEGRMLRLFQTGHREEERILEELRRIGVEVHSLDRRTGRQFSFWALGGHFGGHMDAAARGFLEAPKTWAVTEVKTSNKKRFRELQKKGVRSAKPQHWAQMQTYMGLSGMRRAAYIVVCKDSDTLYFEWVYFDQAGWDLIQEKARRIISAPSPLTRISADPYKPPCSWCDHAELCHEGDVPPVHCRTCAHATPILDEEGGRWWCEGHDRMLSVSDQRRGCAEHVFIPDLVPFAEPIDSGDGFVLYQLRKKKTERFVNAGASSFPAKDVPHLTSEQVRELSRTKKLPKSEEAA